MKDPGRQSTLWLNDELQLSKKYHPDKTGGDISKFHEINDAYATLGDESKR